MKINLSPGSFDARHIAMLTDAHGEAQDRAQAAEAALGETLALLARAIDEIDELTDAERERLEQASADAEERERELLEEAERKRKQEAAETHALLEMGRHRPRCL